MAEQDYIYGSLTGVLPAYEGAAINYKRELSKIIEGDADSLAVRELRFLQARSQNAVRNNGYATVALNKWCTNLAKVKIVWKTPKGKKHDVMQDYWEEFEKNPSFDGYGDLGTTQTVSNSSIFIDGNSYIRFLIQVKNNTNRIPLKLQLIPARLHAYELSNIVSNAEEVVRYGITFENSVPTKYHFRQSILENAEKGFKNIVSVPAEEINHTFIRTTPGQWLGIPKLAPILMSLMDLDDLIGATIEKQKAAQAIAIIVENANNLINQMPVGAVNTYTDPADNKIKVKFNAAGTNVQYLNKGEKASMFQGADIGDNFISLVRTELNKIAATLDLAYHELTSDTSGLNYSSLIGLSILSRTRLEYLHNFIFIPLREAKIAEKFKAIATLHDKRVAKAIPYFQLPKWRSIDDLKDSQADVLELQNSLAKYEDKLAERGLSVEDIIADKELLKTLEEYGVRFEPEATSMVQANNVEANDNTSGT